jgi:hypothetical protein
LKEELLRTKNYASVGKFLAALPRNDVKSLLKEWVIGTSTGLGAVSDYDEQRWLTEDLGLSNDLRLTDRLYYEAGGRAFPELASHDTGHMKEARIMEMAIKGSAKHHGVEETIKALPGLLVDEHAVPSVKKSVEWLLSNNSTESSIAIGNLPSGYSKDVMIEAMIIWLRRKDEADSAEPWIDVISDPTLKARLSKGEP